MAFDPTKFKTEEAKPLPIILLLDTSGSMSIVLDDNFTRTGKTGFVDGRQVEFVQGGTTRISALNSAVKKMIATLAKEETDTIKFSVSIVQFSTDAKIVMENANAKNANFQDLQSDGNTSLGAAIDEAKELIEDKNRTPSRAYRPTVVLVSDGQPNDNGWEEKLKNFIENGRSAKCDRWAMGIGNEDNSEALNRFVEGTNNKIVSAQESGDILNFFKMVTMSVSVRSKSVNPNDVQPVKKDNIPKVAISPNNKKNNSGENGIGYHLDAKDDEDAFW